MKEVRLIYDAKSGTWPTTKIEPNEPHTLVLIRPEAAVLPIEDSALASDPIESFARLLAAFFRYRKEHPNEVVCLASHYKDGDSADQNDTIARERALCLYTFLSGKQGEWTKLCLERGFCFDYQNVFTWLSQYCNIPCSPAGCEDSDVESKLQWAWQQFRQSDGKRTGASVCQELTFAEQDWNRLYTLYLARIADLTGMSSTDLEGLQSSAVFTDPPAIIGADAQLPHALAGGNGNANRVDILFFKEGDVPPLPGDPPGGSIYGVRKFKAVAPVAPSAASEPTTSTPAASAPAPSTQASQGALYTVKSGDTLVKLAAGHGLASWKDIYNAPQNADYRKSHPDPDKIGVGDKVWIPAPPAQGPAVDDPEGYPLLYSYQEARQNGISEALRSRRPAVGYAQRRLNIFLKNYDDAQSGAGASDERHPFDPVKTKAYREKVPAELDVDCVFGDETANAVKALQASKGIKVDGKIGQVTWDWLEFQARKTSQLARLSRNVAPIAGFFGFPWMAGSALSVTAALVSTGPLTRAAAKPPLTAYEAVAQFYVDMQQWAIGCAWFVQIAHLYALAATLGRTAFNARLGSRAYANVPDSTPASEFNTAAGTPFYFRSHKSGGIATEVCYFAADKKSSMQNQVTKVTDPRSPSEILASAPEGSRVCFRNPQSQSSVWMNENTIKLGPDRYAAHGAVGSTGKNVFSSAELKEIMCVNGKSTDPGEIFVQYIEHYEDPPFLHSRDSFVQALEDAVAKLKSCGFAYPVSMDGEYVQGFDHYDPAVWKEISSGYEPDPAWLKMKTSYGV